MRLDRFGRAVLAGAGPVSVDGTVIYWRGSVAAWRGDAVIVNGLESGGHPDDPSAWHLYECVPGGDVHEIHPLGANEVKAGGGRWAAYRDRYGLFLAEGFFSREAGLRDVGPGGELVYVRQQQTGQGLVVSRIGQAEWEHERKDLIAFDVRSYGGTRVSWRNADGTIQSSFTPTPVMIPGERVLGAIFVRIGHDEWMVYQNGVVLRARPILSTVGIAIHSETPEHYFNHDAIVLPDGRLQVSWSHGQGEWPSDYRPPVIVDVTTAPRVDFAHDPERPTPNPEPEPEPTPDPREDEPPMPVPTGEQFRNEIIPRIQRIYNEPEGLNRSARGNPLTIAVSDGAAWDWITRAMQGVSLDQIEAEIRRSDEWKQEHPTSHPQ